MCKATEPEEREADQNRSSGRMRTGYAETVLRFTHLNPSQLYLQAACVSYDRYGKFEDKIVFYGTVNRGQAASPIPNLLDGSSYSNPFFFGH